MVLTKSSGVPFRMSHAQVGHVAPTTVAAVFWHVWLELTIEISKNHSCSSLLYEYCIDDDTNFCWTGTDQTIRRIKKEIRVLIFGLVQTIRRIKKEIRVVLGHRRRGLDLQPPNESRTPMMRRLVWVFSVLLFVWFYPLLHGDSLYNSYF